MRMMKVLKLRRIAPGYCQIKKVKRKEFRIILSECDYADTFGSAPYFEIWQDMDDLQCISLKAANSPGGNVKTQNTCGQPRLTLPKVVTESVSIVPGTYAIEWSEAANMHTIHLDRPIATMPIRARASSSTECTPSTKEAQI
jgi:hypothetical protein